jgi:hypothetical protein
MILFFRNVFLVSSLLPLLPDGHNVRILIRLANGFAIEGGHNKTSPLAQILKSDGGDLFCNSFLDFFFLVQVLIFKYPSFSFPVISSPSTPRLSSPNLQKPEKKWTASTSLKPVVLSKAIAVCARQSFAPELGTALLKTTGSKQGSYLVNLSYLGRFGGKRGNY